MGEREMPKSESQWNGAKSKPAHEITAYHHRLAVPTVDKRTCRQTEQQVGQEAHRGQQSRLRRRMRKREYQQGQGQGRNVRPQSRNGLTIPQQKKVAITPKWAWWTPVVVFLLRGPYLIH